MSLPTLTFEHRFSSGREITLTIFREENTRPRVTASLQYGDLTDDEKSEFRCWRLITLGRVMRTLTPEEVCAVRRR